MSILRRVTDFILQGRSQAMGVAFVCAYIPLLGSISILIAGLVTLRKGVLEGFLVLCAAIIPLIINYYAASVPAEQLKLAQVTIGLVIVSNILVWLYAGLLRQYANWNLLLEVSLFVAVVLIGIAHLIYPNLAEWWGTQLTAYFTRAAAIASGLPNPDIKTQLQVVNIIKHYATGLMLTSLILNGLLQVGLARWWQAAMFNPGGLRKELYSLRLSNIVGILFILVLVASFWSNAIVLDIKPVFYALFSVAGFSLLHWWLATKRYGWVGLLIAYIAAILLFPESLMIIAILALLDVLLDLRKRLTRV